MNVLVVVKWIKALMRLVGTPKKIFKSSFLVQKKDAFIPVASEDFAFFFIQNGIVKGMTTHNQTYSFTEKLEELEQA